ncbi:MAG: sodium-dependent transporter, partial [Oleibacter sp.]|nr:sodium-dependent transporter [Thalassolituus sp.]
HTITGKTVFDMLDFLTTNLLMPLGGVMIAIFVGWFMSWRAVTDEARLSPAILQVWKVMIRVISPAAVALVFINGLL